MENKDDFMLEIILKMIDEGMEGGKKEAIDGELPEEVQVTIKYNRLEERVGISTEELSKLELAGILQSAYQGVARDIEKIATDNLLGNIFQNTEEGDVH